MTKILLTIFLFLVLSFILFTFYRALFKTRRSAKNNKNKRNDIISVRKQICPKCKTGKHTFELDHGSDICPNISCWKDGTCPFFLPIEKFAKSGLLNKSKNKETIRK